MNTQTTQPSGKLNRTPKTIKRTAQIKKTNSDNKSYIIIDYPLNGQTISNPQHFSIRIGASKAEKIEIMINKSDWNSCRFSEGYYWFDWSNIPTGKHEIVSRIQLPNGKFKKSKIVKCHVN